MRVRRPSDGNRLCLCRDRSPRVYSGGMPVQSRVRIAQWRWRAALVALVAAVAGATAHATTFAPVTFDDLVAKADVIFVGDVLDVRPFTVRTANGELIKTRVTFLVKDALWGTTSSMESFEFLGGVVGSRGLRVAEMPTFTPGDRRVVFARRDGSINPIVGFTQGLLRVTRDDAGGDAVQTSDGAPLASTLDVGRSGTARVRTARPMPLSSLRAQIVTRLLERRR
jgi:hypothetical protein